MLTLVTFAIFVSVFWINSDASYLALSPEAPAENKEKYSIFNVIRLQI